MNGGDERFERRLVEETSTVRVEVAAVEMRLTDRIGQVESKLTDRIGQVESQLRQEIGAVEVRVVDRVAQLEVRMERGFGSLRSDMIKWSFAFWIGQVVAMTAIMSALLRP